MLAWSSGFLNNISVIELENKQNYAIFKGVQIKDGGYILFLDTNPNFSIQVGGLM